MSALQRAVLRNGGSDPGKTETAQGGSSARLSRASISATYRFPAAPRLVLTALDAGANRDDLPCRRVTRYLPRHGLPESATARSVYARFNRTSRLAGENDFPSTEANNRHQDPGSPRQMTKKPWHWASVWVLSFPRASSPSSREHGKSSWRNRPSC